jgi:hypothetical protein
LGALCVEDPGAETGPELAEAWAANLLDLIQKPQWPREEYLAACSSLGADLVWEPSGRGRAVDVAGDGSLVVLTDEGEVRLSSGAVRHVRRQTE